MRQTTSILGNRARISLLGGVDTNMPKPDRNGNHATVKERRAVYFRRARRALLMDLLANGTATADDVADAVALPPGIDLRCLGAVARPLARANVVRAVARVASVRPGRSSSQLCLWALVNRAAALRWLQENPDRRGPAESGGADDVSNLPFFATPNEPTPTGATAGAGVED